MRQNETRKAANLTKKQLQALPYLVASVPKVDAAKMAELSPATKRNITNDLKKLKDLLESGRE